MEIKFIIYLHFLSAIVYGRQGFGPTDQEWGYVTVREGAHMFWWLHKTTAEVANYTDRPLIIWLTGGPGASSTGYGNFAELGPLDTDLNPRNTTWVKDYNVLFVDNPVGCGFSYVDSPEALVTNNKQIARDFLVLVREFYETIPELKKSPLYIFTESYGAKMTVDIALVLDEAFKNETLDVQLLAVGLGDGSISPENMVMSYGSYLFNFGAIDQEGYDKIQELSMDFQDAIDRNNYTEAWFLDNVIANTVANLTSGLNVYNVLSTKPGGQQDEDWTKVEVIMNNYVNEALGVNVTWRILAQDVYDALIDDIIKPVTDEVELLLNGTDIQIAVYNGQLDGIINTPGTVSWLNKLKFTRKNEYVEAKRQPIVVDNIVEGYYKKGGNLAMYWVDRAGHMVPIDNTAAMAFILTDVIG